MTETYVNLHVHLRKDLKPDLFLGAGGGTAVDSHLRVVWRAMTLLYVGRGSVRGRNAQVGALAAAREENVLRVWRWRTRGAEARPNGRIEAAEAIDQAGRCALGGGGGERERDDGCGVSQPRYG